jgi:hypothetical protein
VVVRWISEFPIERTGQADVRWNGAGWLLSGTLTLATHNPGGLILPPQAVYTVALHEIGHLLGLGQDSGIGLAHERSGTIPTSGGLHSRADRQPPPVRGRVPHPPIVDAASARLIPAGTFLSFPGRSGLPRHERNLLSRHPTSIPHWSRPTLCLHEELRAPEGSLERRIIRVDRAP